MTTNTLAAFIEEHGITAQVDWADTNPNMADMPAGSTHWLVTLKRDGAEDLAVPFSMGPAHSSEPEIADVLDCLASDASSVENANDWFDWAEEMGYDGAEQLRQARDTFATIERQTADLREFLPSDAFEQLLYSTERQ